MSKSFGPMRSVSFDDRWHPATALQTMVQFNGNAAAVQPPLMLPTSSTAAEQQTVSTLVAANAFHHHHTNMGGINWRKTSPQLCACSTPNLHPRSISFDNTTISSSQPTTPQKTQWQQQPQHTHTHINGISGAKLQAQSVKQTLTSILSSNHLNDDEQLNSLHNRPQLSSVNAVDAMVAANAVYANAYNSEYHARLPMRPGRKLCVVMCMDSRIDAFKCFGLKHGDAHVIRNAGGRIREAIRSVIVSQALLGTEELAIIHHTECGVLKFDDEQIRDQVMRQQTEQRGLMRRKEQQQRAHEKQHSKPKARRVQAHVVDGLPATDAAFSTDDIGIVSDDDTESCSDDEEEELKTSAAAADAAYLASVATAVNATPFLSFFGSPEESVLNDMAEYRTSSLVKKTIPCRGFVYDVHSGILTEVIEKQISNSNNDDGDCNMQT